MLVADSSLTLLGSYEIPDNGDLSFATLRLYIKNPSAYSHAATLKIASSLGGSFIAQSDVVTLSNATTGQTTTDWLGEVVFSFDNYELKATETYYFYLSLGSYARPARPIENTQYIAIGCDWLEPVGTADSGGARIAMGVYQ
jgi:hypothetical protein